MRILFLILILLLSVSQEIVADFFKWEVLFAEKGFGTEFKTIPIVSEGKIEFPDKKINCRMESFWASLQSDLLMESKSLVCISRGKETTLSVVCRDNNLNRKYNQFKELYPVTKAGFSIDPKLFSVSPYMELRCYF